MVKKNDIFTVEVTDINNLGYGICRVDNIVTFVNGAADGDVCDIRIIKVNKDYCIAKIEKFIKKSPYRIESECPVSIRCGGCVYQNISYEHELDLKRNYVMQTLRKFGLIHINVDNVVSTGQINGYRNKVQYPVGDNNIIGYYASHSHNIVECIDCRLQNRMFDSVMIDIRDFLIKYNVDCVRHIYLRYGSNTGDLMICLVINNDKFNYDNEFVEYIKSRHDISSIMLNINKSDTNVILGNVFINLYGNDYITDMLNGLKFYISASSFYQINHDAAELLYQKIGDCIDFKNGDSLLDLYCGTGTIGLYLASRFNVNLKGVEIVSDAVDYAKLNADINNIKNAEFICGDINKINDIGTADVVVIDPPRKGCSLDVIRRICSVNPKSIAYVSCNPDTLARDLKEFAKSGYVTDLVTPVDMFPRTGHVECACLLTRTQG